LFTRLGERLQRRGVVGDVYVIGGAAIVAPGGDPTAPLTFDHPGLRVSTASPEHLLAMKAVAARRRDIDDLRILVGVLQLTTAQQVVAICARVFPDEQLPDRTHLILEFSSTPRVSRGPARVQLNAVHAPEGPEGIRGSLAPARPVRSSTAHSHRADFNP
jgi:hypothetical protein